MQTKGGNLDAKVIKNGDVFSAIYFFLSAICTIFVPTIRISKISETLDNIFDHGNKRKKKADLPQAHTLRDAEF